MLDAEGFPLRHGYAVYPAGRELSAVARAFLDYLLGREDAAPVATGKKNQRNGRTADPRMGPETCRKA